MTPKITPLFLSVATTSQLVAQAFIAAPSDLTLTPTSNSVMLRWIDHADNESGYKVYRNGTLITLLPPDTTEYLDSGLHPSTTYRYTLKATTYRTPTTVALTKEDQGISLHSLKVNDQEMLQRDSSLFTLTLQNLNTQDKTEIDSRNGWGDIAVRHKGNNYEITLSQPTVANLPATLSVHLKVETNPAGSKWDMDVTGVGDAYSLIDLTTPELHLKLFQDAKLLIPKYSGVLKESNEAIDLSMNYPAGWQSTMQFFAYYNQKGGLYIGNHDPKASKKRFVAKKDEANHELIYTTHITPPDKTKPNNNFSLSGVFELDGFEGDWYDAAQIYKEWASKSADYYPHMTPERKRRQHKIGEIALWANSQVITEYMKIADEDRRKEKIDNYLNFIKYEMGDLADTFSPLPVAFVWDEWYKLVMDRDYPHIFYPEAPLKNDIKSTVDALHQQHPNLTIMPYTNGFIFDMEAGHFTQEARDASLKKSDGSPYTQKWNHHDFAIMDPSQIYWQNQISGAARVVLKDIDADGIYIDQVTASAMREDMDEHHAHPLAGGTWWREGYAQMFSKIDAFRGDKFITSEGMADYMADHIDGFFLHYRGVNHMVPAYQAVYGGKVQLFGLQMDTGAYDTLRYYMSRMRAFIFGVQPGIITQWLLHDPRDSAKINYAFIKKLATMHYRLREFFAYGDSLRDIEIPNDGGQLQTVWQDYGEDQQITMPALLHGVYRSEDGNKIAFIVANTSKEKHIHYTFDIDPARYGFGSNVKVTQIDFDSQSSPASLHVDTDIAPHTAVAYILSQE